MHLKRIVSIFKYLILCLVLLFVLFLAGINLPFSQRIITEKTNGFFRKKNLPVQVDKITLLLNGKIGLTRIHIIKNTWDTLVFAQQIRISVRMVPLLFKKVEVNSIQINDATVHITTDPNTGTPDLVSLFTIGTKPGETKEKSGKPKKKWDISIISVNLQNILFTYNDALHGIQINESIGKFNIRFDRFSLISKQLYASFLDLEKAHGGLTLSPSSHTDTSGNKLPSPWNFKLSQSDLRDILFTLHQPDENQRFEFSLDEGDISDAGFDLAGSRISAARILLEEPGIHIFSSTPHTRPESRSNDTSSLNFPGLWNITGNDVKISNGYFQKMGYPGESGTGIIQNGSFQSESSPGESGLNHEDDYFQISSFNTTLKDIKLNSRESGFNMNRLSFTLGNGFQLDRGEITFNSDSTLKSRLDLNLMTASSRINLKAEAGNRLSAIIKAFNKVPISLKIEDTEISTEDILTFLPNQKEQPEWVKQEDLKLEMNCDMAGTADLLNIRNFRLNTSSGVTMAVSGQVAGIKNPSSAVCSVAFRMETITPSSINELIKLTGASVKMPDFEPLTLEGSINDSLISPEFILNMLSRSGNIAMNGSMNLPEKSYKLKMISSGLELGKLSGINEMDRFSGSVDLTGKGFNPDSMKIKASVTIDSAGYRGYNYHAIHMELDGDRGFYNYRLNSSDTSFWCDLTGAIELNDSSTRGEISGKFSLDAGRLHLYEGMVIRSELEGYVDHTANGLDASVSLNKLVLSKDNNAEDLENLSVSFQSFDTLLTGKIETDFMKAVLRSSGSVDDLTRVFTEGHFGGITMVDSAVGNKIPYISILPELTVSVEANYDPLIGLLLNDSAFNFNKISINLIKDTSGIARAEMLADKFNFGMISGFGATLNLESIPDKSILLVKADSFKYSKILLTGMTIDFTTRDDTARYSLQASDKNSRLLYDITGSVYKSERQVRLRSSQPQWILNGFMWEVSPGDFLVLEPWKNDFITDLHWKNDQRSIDIYGRKSEKIFLDCQNVWLNMLVIPGMNIYGYDGELSGKINYQSHDKNELGIEMDIRQMKMNETPLGNMKITGSYLSDTLGTIESDLSAVINDTSSLNITVRYGKNASQRNIRSDFSSIPLTIVESLASKYISGLDGMVSGELALKSMDARPQLNGMIKISNVSLKVVPLNAWFYLPGNVINIENNELLFNQFIVLDSMRNRLDLDGTINLNDPGNITADLRVISDHLEVMNTSEKENPMFNGSVYVNSKLHITGPVQKPSLTGNIVLADGTVINYRYTEDLSVSETEKTVTFASLTQDQSVQKIKPKTRTTLSKSPDIEATIEIDPNSQFNFDISRGFDIGVRITGGGFLTYSLMPNKEIDLSGNYEINQGSAELKIPGWPRKDFIITPGSYLKWDGEVDNPELQLETTSKVRGSYLNPVDNQNREVNFLVYMKLSDRLSQLEIIFDVRSEDQYLTSVFNSLSTDERMQQAINLLLFGSIQLPNLSSSSDYVTQQINQFWESQLNQITKSAIKKVDVSIGIDSYSEGGSAETYTSLSYEVKKEMFHERGSVLVSGRMNDNSPVSQQSNTVIENFIFEYALDPNRTKYLKVYRQQNYEDLLEGEVIKSGVGFIYRKNYDKLSDIWRRKKKTKK